MMPFSEVVTITLLVLGACAVVIWAGNRALHKHEERQLIKRRLREVINQ
jgi:hypothetical protein